LLLKYVQEVQPQVMETFVERAHPQVVDAMRQTVTNMLGTLPPQFFKVTVSMVRRGVASLILQPAIQVPFCASPPSDEHHIITS